MRILITGAAGFLGSHLCDRFLNLGHEVIGMDNFITGSPDNLAHLSGTSDFRFILHDVADYIFVLEKLMLSCILHLLPAQTPHHRLDSQSPYSNHESRSVGNA